jgi:two-component system, OmpR family, sensor kinase
MNALAARDVDSTRPGWSGSLTGRLILALTGVSVFTLVVVALLFFLLLGGYVLKQQKERLLEQASQVAEQVEALSETMPNAMSMNRMLGVLLRSDLRVSETGGGIVVFSAGEVVARAGVLPVGEQNIARLYEVGLKVGGEAPGSDLVRSVLGVGGNKIDVLVAAAPITTAGGLEGLAVVTLATSDAFAARGSLLRVLLIAGAVAIALAIIVGLGLGSWMGRPLRRLSEAARGMAAGTYDQPVTGTYPGEVQELAGSLELMRQEVQHSEQSLRGFVGSAAHELRTPLTSIEGFSQALLDGTASSEEERQKSAAAIYRESVRLRRLVDALLTLSRYDAGEYHPNSVRLSVGALVQEEVDRLTQTGATAPGRIGLSFPHEVWMVTDADMLRQVVGNLLMNAVQYGGEDSIEVAAWTQGGEAVLRFTNGGIPLGPEEKARIFDRFFRGRAAAGKEGFGLGLALVREICTLLGGRIEVAGDSAKTVLQVLLPLERTPGVPPRG